MRKVFTICSIITIMGLCVCSLSQEKWKQKMDMPNMEFAEHTDTFPHVEPVTPYRAVFNIFQVSLPHAIATNDWDNAITVLHLNEDGLKKEVLSRDFFANVSGGDISPTPLFDDEWIAYGQTRRFVRYNLRTNEVARYSIGEGFEETIVACRALIPGKKIFAFMIQSIDNKHTVHRIFKTFDLSGQEPKLIASLNAGILPGGSKGATVSVLDSLLIYYDRESEKLISLNSALQPAKHPLSDAFNKNKEKLFKLLELVIHPSLPFAIVHSLKSAGDKDITFVGVLSWKTRDYDLFPFAGMKKDMSILNFSFSQDGKYLAWEAMEKGYDPDKKAQFWIAPIDRDIPGYVGNPQLLGNSLGAYSSVITMAWARNPNTFVVSSNEAIYWWHIK
jgi:WD40 repeat protein